MTSKLALSFAFLACLSAFSVASGTITNGSSTVGLDSLGTLYTDGTGFSRNSDGYDPIEPGTPRDSWSLFYGGTASYADPYYFGSAGIGTINFSQTANSALSTVGLSGAFNLTQNFSFVDANVLRLDVSVQNLSGVAQSFKYRRNVDFDILPNPTAEYTNVPGVKPSYVSETSYYGFEGPYDPFGYNDPSTHGAADLGAGITADFGTIGVGGTSSYSFYYAISKVGQSADELRSQMAGLGAEYSIVSWGQDGSNSAALGIGPRGSVSSVPGPSALAAFGIGLARVSRRRRNGR